MDVAERHLQLSLVEKPAEDAKAAQLQGARAVGPQEQPLGLPGTRPSC